MDIAIQNRQHSPSDEAQIFSQACARACLIDSQIETANRTEPLSTYNRNNFFFIIPIGQI